MSKSEFHPFRGSMPPKRAPGGYVPIFKPKSRFASTAVLLNSSILGVMTHWSGEQTVPCDETSECELCKRQHHRWKGFSGCLWGMTKLKGLVEISRHAGNLLMEANPVHDFRGFVLQMAKRDDRKCSPIDIMVIDKVEDKHLPPPVNVAKQLCFLWEGYSLPLWLKEMADEEK